MEDNRVFDHTHGLLSAGASVARQNAITGEEVLSAGRALPVGDILCSFPVALLIGEGKKAYEQTTPEHTRGEI